VSGGPLGFVGLGRMGWPMSRRLSEAGWKVIGVDPSEEARSRASASGMTALADLSGVRDCLVVMSSLPDTPQVLEVYGELIPSMAPGGICIDLSTISVASSRNLAAAAAERGISFVDAPVSGTSIHAEAGTLAVMAGGEEDAVNRAREYLVAFSTTIQHVGPNGAGLVMKLISNRLLTTHLVAIAEAIVEIEQAGLDIAVGLEALRAGAVPRLLDYKAEPMANRDYTPRFTVDLMSKDMRLAGELLPPGRLGLVASEILEAARAAGLGADDLGAVMEIVVQNQAEAQPVSGRSTSEGAK
jgi:3-hydroxyisobutyrate dehydrogenase-like beta-hydroxyacid dehydrogenase